MKRSIWCRLGLHSWDLAWHAYWWGLLTISRCRRCECATWDVWPEDGRDEARKEIAARGREL